MSEPTIPKLVESITGRPYHEVAAEVFRNAGIPSWSGVYPAAKPKQKRARGERGEADRLRKRIAYHEQQAAAARAALAELEAGAATNERKP